MKLFLILQVLLGTFILQSTSCIQREDDSMVKWKGMDDAHDLVFLYKKGTTYEQKQQFHNEVLSKERGDGRGRDHPDGVVDVISGTIVDDYEGGIVNFSKDASSSQRETLKKAIRESPIVHKVYENAVPNKIVAQND